VKLKQETVSLEFSMVCDRWNRSRASDDVEEPRERKLRWKGEVLLVSSRLFAKASSTSSVYLLNLWQPTGARRHQRLPLLPPFAA
jgi:hypothetical protein